MTASSSGSPGPPDGDERLAALERAVEALRADVAALRAAARVQAPPTVAPPASPAAREPMRRRVAALGVLVPSLDRVSVETLVGRYGALAVGALVLLMGVGAFLTWAVENFTLAPAARVALGAAAALTLAALGERLRRRDGAERYGEVLLGLALAVVHVDAWAAGPYLGVVSAAVALGAAAAASAALTALAWRAGRQSLFVVGVGGALLAPFVSGAANVHLLVRPVYGWVVLTAGVVALVRGSSDERPWYGAAGLLGLGGAVYALAQLLAQLGRVPTAPAAVGGGRFAPSLAAIELPAAFALACAAGPLAAIAVMQARRPGAAPGPTGALLRWLALAGLATGVLVLAAAALAAAPAPSLVAYALAATAASFGLLVAEGARGGRLGSIAGFGLPLAALGAALVALARAGTPTAAGVAGLWSLLAAAAAVIAWRRSTAAFADPRLGPPVAAAGVASALALVLWTNDDAVLRAGLLGAHAGATSALFSRLPGRAPGGDARPLLALAPPLLVLTGATGWAALLLAARPPYAYTPFRTPASAAALVVVLGWAACATAVWRAGDAVLPRGERAGVVWVAAGVALLWGRAELARAVAPDVATFLLVGYFAAAGVAVLALGRARGAARARQAGLGLALYAALKAVVEGSQLDAVVLRVGSYLLVGGFLLGVGYWYRGGERGEAA